VPHSHTALSDGNYPSQTDPFAPFAAITDERTFVIAQLGQSLDGRIATVTGESRWINGTSALDHLHRIRAHVDAVLVGIGTVIADDPQLTVRRVEGRSPARVVLDPRGRLPVGCRCLAPSSERLILLRAERGHAVPAGVEEIVLDAVDGRLSPDAIVKTLHAAGLRRILVEGGSHTISSFIEAGCVDRLHVLVAPMIIGSGKPGLEMTPIAALDRALRPATRTYVLADGDVLFDCDLRTHGPNARGGDPP
jgi:diaminohydroxyphosphoribosylaminopyrimidine deaminase/5-amino-6-(5-phosphoribosylamino)uracil reductase